MKELGDPYNVFLVVYIYIILIINSGQEYFSWGIALRIFFIPELFLNI